MMLIASLSMSSSWHTAGWQLPKPSNQWVISCGLLLTALKASELKGNHVSFFLWARRNELNRCFFYFSSFFYSANKSDWRNKLEATKGHGWILKMRFVFFFFLKYEGRDLQNKKQKKLRSTTETTELKRPNKYIVKRVWTCVSKR